MPRLEATIKPLEFVLGADINKAAAWVVLGDVVTLLELVACWHVNARLRIKHVFHAQCESSIFDAGVGHVQVRKSSFKPEHLFL